MKLQQSVCDMYRYVVGEEHEITHVAYKRYFSLDLPGYNFALAGSR